MSDNRKRALVLRGWAKKTRAQLDLSLATGMEVAEAPD